MAVNIGAGIATPMTAYGQIESTTTTEVAVQGMDDTEAAVRAYFSDIPVMVQVARCESTFRHTLADGSVLRGIVDNRDVGVMQINTGYHGETAAALGLDLSDLYDNMAYARYLYETQGVQPWSASRSCWGNTVAMR